MINLRTLLGAAALGLAMTPAQADVVDFNVLPEGNTFNPIFLSGVTFFTPNGFNNIVDFAGSNTLCTAPRSDSSADCSRTLEILFGQQASEISFDFAANNETTIGADIGEVTLFGGSLGDVLLGTVDMRVLDGNAFTLDTVALTGFTGVTRMFLTSTDEGGVVYDNFRFQLAVPEPATWAMMIGGFGLAGVALRRRETVTATA